MFMVYFLSRFSHQHVSVAIGAIVRVMLLSQQYKRSNAVSCVAITA
jgi:hypothetical protein